MLVYGREKQLARFQAMVQSDERVRKKIGASFTAVSELKRLIRELRPEEPVLLLDQSDFPVLRLLYRSEHTKVFIPVGNDILGVSEPDADARLEKILAGCTGWAWHKEANRFRMLRAYLLRRAAADYLPSHIQLEHTSYCNAMCIMCGHAIYGNRGAHHISEEMIQRIMSLLPTCELMVLHGYGEPLMTKNLEQLLALYKDYGVEVTTNTNLSYLPDHILEELAQVARHLRISCDGVTREMYEGIRPGLEFDNFLENLDRLRTRAPELELMMETVIMRQNVEQIPDMVRFAKEHGFSQISLNRLGSHPVLNNERDSLIYYPNMTSHFLREGLELGEKLGIRVIYPVEWLLDREAITAMLSESKRAKRLPFRMEPLLRVGDQTMMPADAELIGVDEPSLEPGAYGCLGMCDSLIGRTNLDLYGNVYACCMNTRQRVGNLFEQTDSEFYNAPALVKLREQFFSGTVPHYCDRCSYVMNRTLELADIDRRDEFMYER